ncbi:MAG: hypothetical protein MEP57_01895 [Microvirga sp.]|nr:hypothetical protein [Microvirga sp.]
MVPGWLDPDTRDAAREAARRAGMSLDEWLQATISDRATRAFTENPPIVRRRPPPAQPPAQTYDDLDAVASRIARITRGRGAQPQPQPQPRSVAAAAPEVDRKSREGATRTADALDSVARWIERAEDRMSESTRVLSEGTRMALDRQDRTANVLGEALSLMTKRLDDIERKVVEGRKPSLGPAVEAMGKIEGHLADLSDRDDRRPVAAPQTAQVESVLRGFEQRIASIAGKLGQPVPASAPARDDRPRQSSSGDVLETLRADISRLASQLESPAPDRADAVGAASQLRRGVGDLASRVAGLATRDDLAALEINLTELSREAVAAAKAGREADLERINALVERVHGEIERIAVEAASGAYGEAGREYRALSARIEDFAASDKRLATSLARELETVRGALAKLADPERLVDLQEHIRDLSQRVGHLARNQVTSLDFAGLRSAVEEIRGAVKKAPGERDAAREFAEIERQYGSIVERLSGLSDAQPTRELARLGDAVAAMGDRLEALAASAGKRETELLSRELAAMAAGLVDLRDGAKATDLDALGDRVEALGERIETFASSGPDVGRELAELRRSVDEALAGAQSSAHGELGALRESIDRLAQERPAFDIGREFTQLRRGVELAIADVRSTLPTEFDVLKARIDRLADERPTVDLTPVSEQIARLAEKLDAIRAEARPDFDHAFSELRAGVENALTNAPSNHSHELGALIERLDRLDENVRSIDVRGGVRSLEDMLAQLASRIDAADRPNAGAEAVDALETQIEAIARRLETERDASVEAVARAARSAVVESFKSLPRPSFAETSAHADIDDLTRSLSEIKELQSLAQERGAEAVGGVQTTLDKLVERLASLETHMQSGAQAARSAGLQKRRAQTRPVAESKPDGKPDVKSDARRTAPVAAHASFGPEMTPARLLDLAKARAGVALSPRAEADRPVATVGSLGGDVPLEPGVARPRQQGESEDPAQIKASFIAAARRAAQNAAAEAAAASRRGPSVDARSARSPLAQEKTAAAAAGRRRPLLMAAAAVVLAIGAFQIGSTVIGGSETVDLAGEPREFADPVLSDISPSVSDPASSPLPARAPALASAGEGSTRGETPDATASIGARLDAPQEPSVIGMDDLMPLGPAPEIEGQTSNTGEAPALPPRRNPLASAAAPETETVASAATASPARATTLYPSMVSADEIPADGGPEDLRRAVLAGDVSAVYEFASRAAEGRGMTRDPALAAKLFERAAAHGLVPAQFRIGNHYEKGIGVTRDFALATLWYERAAESGNARAMHNLAVLLAEGVNGGPDYAAALNWFRRAAEHGVRDSQYNLAVLLARGLGADQNLEESYAWFAIAAQQGDEDAAGKRDEVASRLDERALAMAKAKAETWRPEIPRPEANEVAFPGAVVDDRSARQAGTPGFAG